MKKQLITAGLGGLLCSTAMAGTSKLSGYLEAEYRYYPQDATFEEQDDNFGSLAAEIEAYWTSDNENHSVRFKPFGRITTAEDGNRDHADIRELYYTYAGSGWQVEAGINKVYWGVAESAHLVDIINQTDAVEAFNGEEKLGQPMVSLGLEQSWGNLDFYILPYFREGKFSDGSERNKLPDPINYDKTLYESDDEEKHIDFAMRWAHYFGDVDVGVSYFNGTNRDAIPIVSKFIVDQTQNPPLEPTEFASYYEQLQQVGLDLQYIWEDWAFKFEGTAKQLDTGNYNSAVAGFEYTLSDVNFSGIDIGLLAEYMWNDRKAVDISGPSLKIVEYPEGVDPEDLNLEDQELPVPGEFLSPFENDIFIGTRFTMNDVDSTDFLAGIIYDLESSTAIGSFEGSTRFGESLRVSVNLYILTTVPEDSSFYYSRRDDQIEVKAQWYF